MENPIKAFLQKEKENEEKNRMPDLTPDIDPVAYYELMYLKYKTDIALIMGMEVTGIDKFYDDAEGNLYVVVDVETQRFMVYVTLMNSGAEEKLLRYKAVNAEDLKIILFAPHYSDINSINYIESELGIKIIYSFDDLKKYIPLP